MVTDADAAEPQSEVDSSLPTLQEYLEEPSDEPLPEAAEDLEDPVALFRRLAGSGRFYRDKRVGRVYHPGALSLRENLANNSLHIVIDGNRISAHVDRVSPLGLRPERRPRYSLGRIALHNVAGIAADAGRLFRGRQGDHRCELNCEWMPPHAPEKPHRHSPLLDPERSPWGVHIEARVTGRLDEHRLRRALLQTTPGVDSLHVVDCPDDAALKRARTALQAVAVPLDNSPPLRACLARHPEGDVLILNVNHAAADGPGSLMVLRAIARAYASQPDGHPPVDFLATRDVPVGPVGPSRQGLARRYQVAFERVRDLLARPVRLEPDQASEAKGHGFHLLKVEEHDPASLVSLPNPDLDNDILLAALHLAIAVWNQEHGRPDGRIAVLVPVDLRASAWRDDIIGNFSVMARVSTTVADRASPGTTLGAVAAQTERNIRSRTGTALIGALNRNGLLPLWARQSVVVLQPLTANHLLDSAVLSFLGRHDGPEFGHEAGAASELWLSTPSRMPLGLSVGAVAVSGRLHLTFRYPYRLFAPETVRRFAQLYLAQIRLVATAASTGS